MQNLKHEADTLEAPTSSDRSSHGTSEVVEIIKNSLSAPSIRDRD